MGQLMVFTSIMLQLIWLHEAIIIHTYDLVINLVTSLIFVCVIYADFQILSKLLSVDLDTFFGPPPSTHLI